MEMELVLGPLYEDDEHEYVVWKWAPRRGSEPMSDDATSPILGVGMHPWGKWGRNFVEYGVVAAQAALADAGVDVARHPVRRPAPTRCATATPATSPARRSRRRSAGTARRSRRRTPRARRASTALDDRPRPDPRRVLRRRAGRRRRHHAEGLPRPEQGRARRRPRLAALPAARRDQPDVLRAVRPPAHGAVRRDPRRTSPR